MYESSTLGIIIRKLFTIVHGSQLLYQLFYLLLHVLHISRSVHEKPSLLC